MMKLQFEASDGKNILWGEADGSRICAEIEVPDGASEDYGYITMKKAILAELDKMGKKLALAFWYDGQEQYLADDADVAADVDVDIELEEEGKEMTTRAWRVYGEEGHRQKESFCESVTCTTWSGGTVILRNADKTGTNEYAEIIITAEDADACERALHGQISDGAFENYRVGVVEEIEVFWYALQRDPSDDWGDGTFDKAEALKRLAEDDDINLIAVIDNRTSNPVCVEEIRKEDL